MTNCPDPALMASFVDNRTSIAETNILINHLAECEECREWLSAIVQDKQELQLNQEPQVTSHRRKAVIVFLVILALLLFFGWASLDAQTVVYTNQGSVVVREIRTVHPAAAVPVSIQRRADELQALGEFHALRLLPAMRSRTRVGSNIPVAVPMIVPQKPVVSTPMAPLFIDGLYVGPSPNGQWTSISHITPTINIRMIK